MPNSAKTTGEATREVADHVSAIEIKKHLYSSFSSVAVLLGYSEVHGRIIAALTASGQPMSLADLSRETSYAASSISTSLDLLEVLGMIAKVKKAGDRKLYVRLDGDLLDGLKRALVAKGKKSLTNALSEFATYEAAIESLPKDDPERAKVENILLTLRKELEVLTTYLDLLGEIRLPKE